MLDAITKQLNDISREVCNLQSKYAFAESFIGKISDAQATLVNQMAAKPISLEDKSDEDPHRQRRQKLARGRETILT